ncbi:PREDICTED: methylglutaconyl-CoA hydratase, mitochondrial [Nicrophorus vespilloides]|uniref:Methylglutaconyl-CoA hydratase, mitochondrial n=1 Tax=Nicrophorus vespilloides TaxID=110193 RepID=A0ABM1NJ88_NICVS|nr:PREDICTED: methylglutaconyl-CoA hydratase, mitochondrial [Nicrophorus vespilloides]
MALIYRNFRNLSRVGHFKHINSASYSQKVVANDELVIRKLDEKDAGVTVFGLNRPKARNAFSTTLVDNLNRALDEVAVDSNARVLLIRSMVPGVFGAGADLKERATMTQKQVSIFVTSLRAMMNRIHELPIPVIAALDGLALGGGLELALACDIRVASIYAKLGLVETKLAIIPGAGGSQRLPRLINPAVAKELIYTARIFDGKEAKELGVVNHAVEQNEEGDAAYVKSLDIAREILPNGPVGVKMAKAAINQGLEVDLKSAFEFEKSYYAQLIPTKDRLEGLQAFKEKRTPKYIGE